MSKPEIQKLMSTPLVTCDDCTHELSVSCIKCLANWKTFLLETAGISILQWQDFELKKKAAENKQ